MGSQSRRWSTSRFGHQRWKVSLFAKRMRYKPEGCLRALLLGSLYSTQLSFRRSHTDYSNQPQQQAHQNSQPTRSGRESGSARQAQSRAGARARRGFVSWSIGLNRDQSWEGYVGGVETDYSGGT